MVEAKIGTSTAATPRCMQMRVRRSVPVTPWPDSGADSDTARVIRPVMTQTRRGRRAMRSTSVSAAHASKDAAAARTATNPGARFAGRSELNPGVYGCMLAP
jgi:hypothetical protein